MQKICAKCTKPFMPERSNQRFCGPTCRSAFHNGLRDKEGPNLVLAEHTMHKLLDEHYDPEAHCYDEGWSDQKIADDAGLAIPHVKRIREALYGKPRNAAAEALQLELAAAIARLNTERAELVELVRTTLDGQAEQLLALKTRIDKALEGDAS